MARKKQTKQRKQIKRQTRRFQLRVEHPIDQHVAEILDYKRSQRAEVTAIRDGVRLLWALENNDLDVLFELFPQYRAKLTPDSDGGGQLESLNTKLELLLAQAAAGGYVMKSVPFAPALPQPQAVTLAQPPKAEFKKVEAEVSAEEIANNFLSMF